MLKKCLLFTILTLLLSGFNEAHPLKMTFSKLTISPKGDVELETRIFVDDLTEQLQKLYSLPQADFSSVSSDGTQALQQYLTDRFYFEQDGKKLDLWINAVSFSKNGLALVVITSTPKRLDSSKAIFLTNTILCDATPIQVNDIKYRNKHHKLNIGKPKIKIEVN